jgi:hypothetical protein
MTTIRLQLEVDDGEDAPLEVIKGITDSSEAIERSLGEWVRVARTKGHTWEEIGTALGVTRQSAWERFKAIEETDAIKAVMGTFADRGLPPLADVRREMREEEAEIEERKWGELPPGTKWRS